MFFYHCLNPISQMGLTSFTGDYARTQEIQQADALLVRSASMQEMETPHNLKQWRERERGLIIFRWKLVPSRESWFLIRRELMQTG